MIWQKAVIKKANEYGPGKEVMSFRDYEEKPVHSEGHELFCYCLSWIDKYANELKPGERYDIYFRREELE